MTALFLTAYRMIGALIIVPTLLVGCGYQLANPVKKVTASPTPDSGSSSGSSSSSSSSSGSSSSATSSLVSSSAAANSCGIATLTTCDPVKAALAPFGGGNGTAGSPYEIYSPTQLNEVRNFLTSSFKLMCDLDMTGSTMIPIPDPAIVMANFPADAFTGDFNGNQKRIINYTFLGVGLQAVALFSYVGTGGSVSDLGVENISIVGDEYVAGVAAVNDGTISRVYVTGSITATNSYAAGIVNYHSVMNPAAVLADAFSLATISGSGAEAGGIYSATGGGTITNTLAAPILVTGGTTFGPNTGSTYTDNYFFLDYTNQATTAVAGISPLEVTDVTSQASFVGFDFTNDWQMADSACGGLPIMAWQSATAPFTTSITRNEGLTPSTTCDPLAAPFGGGAGQGSYPYLICSVAQLQQVANYCSLKFRLDANLDLSSVANWTPMCSVAANGFIGIFDGNNKTLSNLTINSNSISAGLFQVINRGTVQNLTLASVSVTSDQDYTGALTGQVWNESTLSGISVSGTVTSTSARSYVGGVAGNLIGTAVANLNDLSSSATVTASAGGSYVGGLIGYIDIGAGTLASLTNSGPVTCPQCNYVGGIAGYLMAQGTAFSGTFHNSGAISLTNNGTVVGGLIGQFGGSGTIAPAIFRNSGSITLGSVAASSHIGGIIGEMGATTTLSRLFSSGTITGGYATTVGGLIGRVTGAAIISESASIMTLDVYGQLTGGLIGHIASTTNLYDSYFAGKIYLGEEVGYVSSGDMATSSGIVGGADNGSNISNVLFLAQDMSAVTTSSDKRIFLGSGYTWNVTNGYGYSHDNVPSFASEGGAVTTLAYADLSVQGKFSTFDFTNTWQFATSGYPAPILKWQTASDPFFGTTVTLPNSAPTCDTTRRPFGGGQGTVGNPYLICHADQLWMIDTVEAFSAYFKLTQNLDLAGMTLDNPIGVLGTGHFSGNFDGNSKTISNFVLDSTTSGEVGLFGILDGGTISNLSVSTVSLRNFFTAGKSVTKVGALIGSSTNASSTLSNITVSDVTFNAPLIGNTSFMGAVAGEFYGNLTSVAVSNSTIHGQDRTQTGYVGGIAGILWTGCSTCTVTTTTVRDAAIVGGLVGGTSNATISNSTFSGTVRRGNKVGGLVGAIYNSSTVSGSSSSATITEVREVGGGLVAWATDSSVTTSSFTGSIATDNSSYGCTNTNPYLGGLVGYLLDGTLSSSVSSGTVTSDCNPFYAGGIVGYVRANASTSTVSGNRSTGAVSGVNDVSGGVFFIYDGGSPVTVQKNSSQGTVYSSSGSASGFIGYSVGQGNLVTVQNNFVYSTSIESVGNIAAGFARQTIGTTFFRNFTYTPLTGTTTASFIYSSSFDTFDDGSGGAYSGIHNYYLTPGNTPDPTTRAQPITSGNFGSSGSFEGFDFGAIWQMGTVNSTAMPVLR